MKTLFNSRTLTPSSKNKKPPRCPKENVDPNSMAPDPTRSSPSAAGKPFAVKNRSPLPPRPQPTPNPSGNPLKRKLSLETLAENGPPASVSSDSGVQVIVRMRPLNKEEEENDQIVQKTSPDSVSILDHTFTFDSVADTGSTQQDIFLLVGLPLVENCLAGFNSSIFAYGQTGSGKTYTMWGPPSAFLAENSLCEERGLTPRVFERLFSRIKEEQMKHSDKHLNFECRCSFLEIYNEQITDLLDPTQRNLQIREDVRTGVYVDFLTEEHVSTMNDVFQLLMKGLANRRTGATSINAESSRSHCVFTCVVESRSKSAEDGQSSLKISRINLVDLAGSERQKMTGAAGERLKEAGNINRSLSQLGNLINILAEVSNSGKPRHIPYRDSRLTFLLQESLGGNAKLAMICAISPSNSCKSETFSTLRFAQRAKAIKNKAVVNEITQDDVNVLREQIRQLKDELLRMKSTGTSPEENGSYSTGWNARQSLKLLRLSLNRRMLPVGEDDSDEEMEIDEEDVEKPKEVTDVPRQSDDPEVKHSNDEIVHDDTCSANISQPTCISDQVTEMIDLSKESCETEEVARQNSKHEVLAVKETPEHVFPELTMKESDREYQDVFPEVLAVKETPEHVFPELAMKESDREYQDVEKADDLIKERTEENILGLAHDDGMLVEESFVEQQASETLDSAVTRKSSNVPLASSGSPEATTPSGLSIIPCQISPVLQSPPLSISPSSHNYSRKSLRTSSSMSASQKNRLVHTDSSSGVLSLSFADNLKRSNSVSPTEHLEASLHRGLEIIDSHQHSSPLRRSSFRFSVNPVDLKASMPTAKVDVGIQTLQELVVGEDAATYICSYCKNKPPPLENINNDKELQLVPVDGSHSVERCKNQVPKAVEKVLAGSIRREMALEDHCAKQAAEIVQLNRLLQQYKHERECNAVIEQTREDKISRLESLMDGILPTEEFMEDEFISLTNEHKFLKEKYENHPEVLRLNVELKRVEDELDGYRNFFDLGERDVLMEEIQDLRCQLQYYIDSSSTSARNRSPLRQLTHFIEHNSAPPSTIPDLNAESIEEERRRWTEMESKWISLSEELRVELEANRILAEKRKVELDSEKKCAAELKEALQTAMQGHARILEQYADLQEKHIALLGRHRKMMDGIEDVKRAAAKAGVKGPESRFINSLAAEISALKVEREKERRFWRDEKKGLQGQLRDTAEAVQAAGELLVRLKEAEEVASTAQKRALKAEQETEKAYQEIDNLKKNYEREIITLNQFLAESRLPKEALRPAFNESDAAKYDGGESLSDQRWREEFEQFGQGDAGFSRGTEPHSWFSGYDRCNM